MSKHAYGVKTNKSTLKTAKSGEAMIKSFGNQGNTKLTTLPKGGEQVGRKKRA